MRRRTEAETGATDNQSRQPSGVLRRLARGRDGKKAGHAAEGKQQKSPATGEKHRETGKIKRVFRRSGVRRGLFFAAAIAAVFLAVLHGATPERYKLSIGDISAYDITAPRDIVNVIRTEELARERAQALDPVIIEDDRANIDMLNRAHTLSESLLDTALAVRTRAELEAVQEPGEGYHTALFRAESLTLYSSLLTELSDGELAEVASEDGLRQLSHLKVVLTDRVLAELFRGQITQQNLGMELARGQQLMTDAVSERPWSVIGNALLTRVLQPNSRIDQEATEAQQQLFMETWQKENPVVISKDERILNKDDVVTADKWQVLKELNFIEDEGGTDMGLQLSLLLLVGALAAVTVLLIHRFQPALYASPNLVALTSLVVILVAVMAWLVSEFLGMYASLLLPIFVAPVLLAMLAGLETAIIVNAVLSFAFMVLFGGDATFGMMSFVGGSIAAFLTHQASQRRRVSMSGLLIGLVNVLVVGAMGLMEKGTGEPVQRVRSRIHQRHPVHDSGHRAVAVFRERVQCHHAIQAPRAGGSQPSPHQAPVERGARHLSPQPDGWQPGGSRIRAIGGNALLARVGAYFHDIGKLKRPNFFKENQLADNPHERLTPNLSTLVITSHPRDGDELAQKYRLPQAIRDIIRQHHGTTLVAYFYHKALQADKENPVDPASFRYEGPVPDSRESAVVLLADSIEAAVRSLQEKTRGKSRGWYARLSGTSSMMASWTDAT
jgi:putative nucleotidyltransferase with HDIG domain